MTWPWSFAQTRSLKFGIYKSFLTVLDERRLPTRVHRSDPCFLLAKCVIRMEKANTMQRGRDFGAGEAPIKNSYRSPLREVENRRFYAVPVSPLIATAKRCRRKLSAEDSVRSRFLIATRFALLKKNVATVISMRMDTNRAPATPFASFCLGTGVGVGCSRSLPSSRAPNHHQRAVVT